MAAKVPSNLERVLMKIEIKTARGFRGLYPDWTVNGHDNSVYGEWAGNCHDDVPYGEWAGNEWDGNWSDYGYYKPSLYTDNKILEAFRLFYK